MAMVMGYGNNRAMMRVISIILYPYNFNEVLLKYCSKVAP